MASLTMYFMFLICCYEACHYHRPSDDGRLRNSCKAVPSPTQTITTYPTSPSSSPSQYDESHFFRENVKSPPPSPPYRCCITGHRGVIMIVINIAIMIIIMIILRHKWHPGYNSVPNNAAGAVFPAFIITIITMYSNIYKEQDNPLLGYCFCQLCIFNHCTMFGDPFVQEI